MPPRCSPVSTLSTSSTSPASLAPLFDIIETLGARGSAGNSPLVSDGQLNAIATANRNRTAWTELLRAQADDNELTAYLSLAFNCTYNTPPTNEAADGLLDALPAWKDTPLVRFRLATCLGFRMPALDALLQEVRGSGSERETRVRSPPRSWRRLCSRCIIARPAPKKKVSA